MPLRFGMRRPHPGVVFYRQPNAENILILNAWIEREKQDD
jgi:hypothetical protein